MSFTHLHTITLPLYLPILTAVGSASAIRIMKSRLRSPRDWLLRVRGGCCGRVSNGGWEGGRICRGMRGGLSLFRGVWRESWKARWEDSGGKGEVQSKEKEVFLDSGGDCCLFPFCISSSLLGHPTEVGHKPRLHCSEPLLEENSFCPDLTNRQTLRTLARQAPNDQS